MAIHTRSNLYPGVNTHLNSFLQQPGGGWESFHAGFINDLQGALDEYLPPNYYALAEKSLQISALPLSDEVRRTRPDIGIFRSESGRAPLAQSTQAAAPFATLPLIEVIDDDMETVLSVVVYRVEAGEMPGVPVTRIELLSPANKYPGSDYRQYLARRRQTIRADINLIEIDLLHQQRTLLPEIPSYGDEDDDSRPYLIVVTRPPHDHVAGKIELYGADVLEPLPKVALPLAAQEVVVIDFQVVYATTFRHLQRLAEIVVDYAQDPPAFDRYRPADREQIAALLSDIRRTPPADAP